MCFPTTTFTCNSTRNSNTDSQHDDVRKGGSVGAIRSRLGSTTLPLHPQPRLRGMQWRREISIVLRMLSHVRQAMLICVSYIHPIIPLKRTQPRPSPAQPHKSTHTYKRDACIRLLPRLLLWYPMFVHGWELDPKEDHNK